MNAILTRTAVVMLALASVSGPFLRGQPAPPPASATPPHDTPPLAIHFGGFGDVELHTTSAAHGQGVDLLELDVFSTVTLYEKWSALADGVFSRQLSRHTTGEEIKADIDLQRLYAGYMRSEAFRVEFGETASGIVRWNDREHRSRFLQTPIDLPAIARRPEDNGAWPLRLIGVWTAGRMTGPLGLGYEAGVGAGSGLNRDQSPLFSGDRSLATVVTLSALPEAVDGLEVSIAGYAQHIRTQPEELRERDGSVGMSFLRKGLEIRAEFARMNHTGTVTGTTYRTTGYYALVSRRLPGAAERLRPYVLIDRLRLDPREVYLKNATPENAWAAGLRFDLSPRFSLKGEYRSQRAADGNRESVFGMQIGASF